MPRQARVVAVDVPHHITHRGNNRQDVFLADEDRRRYEQLLSLHLSACEAELIGWCWMTNHVHLIVIPRAPESLSRLIRRVHSNYAQDFNRRWKRDGHLWRSRFYSCALGPGHLDAALLYVDLNPVRARLTGDAAAWGWSSASAHAGGEDRTGLLASGSLATQADCTGWAERLARGQAAETEAALRQATHTGRPFADEAFQEEWERWRRGQMDAAAAESGRRTRTHRTMSASA